MENIFLFFCGAEENRESDSVIEQDVVGVRVGMGRI